MGFFNSIVRGAGMSIGRNLVGDFGRTKKTSASSFRYYSRAENEIEKALNFPIKGKSDTILGNCFNMYQAFDDECRSFNKGALALFLRGSRFTYYKECLEKLEDCKEYLELKNKDDENIEKLDQIWDKINLSLFDFVTSLSNSILMIDKSKDKQTAKDAWYGYKDGYNSAKPLCEMYPQMEKINSEKYDANLISEIENHLKSKSLLTNITKSESPLPVLIGIAAAIGILYWVFLK